MIRSFASADTERFFNSGKSRKLPPLDAATSLDGLRFPPSNKLEALKGDRKGQWSIRVNDQWRVCFQFKSGDMYDVELVDYH